MTIELILPSLFCALAIAVAAGVLSPFVVWRRMAFFSDALAHSAVLGTAFALFLQINPLYGLLLYGLLLTFLLSRFDQVLNISSDALLAIIAQTSLALGLLALGLTGQSLNIERLLFGDILSVAWQDLPLTFAVSSGLVAIVILFWRPLLALCINEELAATENVPVRRFKLLLLLLILALVAIAIQLLGVLLISSLLLMPAAAARRFSQSPTQMVIISPVIAVLSVSLGLTAAWFLPNTSAGPAIVVANALLFSLASLKKPR